MIKIMKPLLIIKLILLKTLFTRWNQLDLQLNCTFSDLLKFRCFINTRITFKDLKKKIFFLKLVSL